MRIDQIGLNKAYEFRSLLGTLRVPGKEFPVLLAPAETIAFDDYFLIPIKKNWRRAEPACLRLEKRESATLSGLLECLGDIDDFGTYVRNVNFPNGEFSDVFDSFAIQIELVDGTYVREPMRLSRVITNHPFRTPASESERREIEALKAHRRASTPNANSQ